jgi:hypothetical protein
MIMLAFAAWRAICIAMAIRLCCDLCGRVEEVCLSNRGGYRFDLRGSGWWLVVDDFGSLAACSADHLNQAAAKRARQAVTCDLVDESAYA